MLVSLGFPLDLDLLSRVVPFEAPLYKNHRAHLLQKTPSEHTHQQELLHPLDFLHMLVNHLLQGVLQNHLVQEPSVLLLIVHKGRRVVVVFLIVLLVDRVQVGDQVIVFLDVQILFELVQL